MSGTHEDAAPAPALSSIESLFRGGTLDLSPGPMTLLSSFFADESDAECRSFSQLLAGTVDGFTLAPSMEESSRSEHHRRPPALALGHQESSMFTVPPGISPTLLLDSRGFFSSGTFLPKKLPDTIDLISGSSTSPAQDEINGVRKLFR